MRKRSEAVASGPRRLLGVGLALGAIALGGCALPAVYRPERVGRLGAPRPDGALSLQIDAETDHVRMGDPVVFQVAVENVGERPLWIPDQLPVIFMWVYANGTRDNFIRDLPREQFYPREHSRRLDPGASIRRRVIVPTEHFPVYGVTEFKAFLAIPENTNPDVEPFACGRTFSNAFGVAVVRRL